MATMDDNGDIIAHSDEDGSVAPERSGTGEDASAVADATDAGATDLTTNVDSNSDGGSDGDEEGGIDSDLSEESEDESSEEESSSDEDGDLDAEEEDDPGKSSGLSEYERLRLERIARNQARLASLGFSESQQVQQPKPKKRKPRAAPQPDGPRRQLPGRSGRATFNETELLEERKKERQLRRELKSEKKKKRRAPCGQCDGCLREHDCMTCVHCYNAYEGNGSGHKNKCIWRRCRAPRNPDEVAGDFVGAGGGDAACRIIPKDATEVTNEKDEHDAECFICGEGGDLVCCDGCPKVYHSNCHKPKIRELPDGEWLCMHCKPKGADRKKKYQGFRLAKIPGETVDSPARHVKCTVRWPEMECIICEGTEVTGPLKDNDWVTCATCDDAYHTRCVGLETRPGGKWRCTTCKERKKLIPKTKPNKENAPSKPLFKGEHDDTCYMCYQGGDLLCCDYCSKAYHMKCHLPPLTEIPEGNWKCQECAAVEMKRMFRCGDCTACKITFDCGQCQFCLDKPKFGGKNRLRQTCIKRKCPFMRYAKPAGSTPITTLTSSKKKDVGEKKRKPSDEESQDSFFTQNAYKKEKVQAVSASPQDIPSNEVSDATTIKSSHAASQELFGVPASEINSIINGKPLRNDPVGNKIRLIIAKALKQRGNSKKIDLACEHLRAIATTPDYVSKILLLGGLKMIKVGINQHADKAIVQAEACALLAEMLWVSPECTAVIVAEDCLNLVVTVMKRHAMHEKVQQMALGVFRAMSYDFANHGLISSVKGIAEILDSMKRNSEKTVILREGCYFLQNVLCNPNLDPQVIQEIVGRDVVVDIINAIKASMDDSDYVGAACGVLANLAIDLGARSHIARYDAAIPTLLFVLGSHNPVETYKCALMALDFLASSHGGSTNIYNADGLSQVLNLVTSTPKDVVILRAGIKLLSTLSKNSSECVKLVSEVDGFNFVLSMMKKHGKISHVQSACCEFLRFLPAADEVQAGAATTAIISAMKKHVSDGHVKFEGSHALIEICRRFPTLTAAVRQNLFVKQAQLTSPNSSSRTRGRPAKRQKVEGGTADQATDQPPKQQAPLILPMIQEAEIDAIIARSKPIKFDSVGDKIRLIILRALKQSRDFKAQDKACEYLRAQATSPANVNKIIELKGLTMVAYATCEHSEKSIVQAEACALLSEMIWVSPASARNIIDDGFLKIVIQSMKRHQKHQKVQQMSVGLMRALSYDFANHDAILSVDGVNQVIESMKRNPKKLDVMREGLYFLQNMLCNPAIGPDTVELVTSKKVVAITVDAMLGSRDNEFNGAACGVLANLAINDDARNHIACIEGAIPALLGVLGWGVETDICRSALNAMALLSTNNTTVKELIVKHGGIQTTLDFLTPPNEEVLVDSGLRLLNELAKDNHQYLAALQSAGLKELITAEMDKNTESPQIMSSCFSMLRHVSPRDSIEAKRIVIMALDTLKRHLSDANVQLEGSQALLHLMLLFPEVSTDIQSGLVATLTLDRS